MRRRRLLALMAATGLSVIAGCAVNPQTGQMEFTPGFQKQVGSIFNNSNPCSNRDRNIGAVAGAALGVLIGRKVHHNAKQTALDALVGGTIGGLVGHALDQRRCALYKIAQQNHLKLASTSVTPQKINPNSDQTSVIGTDVQLQNSEDEFRPGTAVLTPRARRYFAEIAQQYVPRTLLASLHHPATAQERRSIMDRKVLIVGHTSETDTANPEQAARLSQARARAVARVFAEQGVPARNIYYQGAGGTLPVASNATARGQRENRRVQIVDVPNKSYLESYLKNRTPDAGDFAVAASAGPGGRQGAATNVSPSSSRPAASAPTGAGERPSASESHAPAAPGVTHHEQTPHRASHRPTHHRYAAAGYDFGGAPFDGRIARIDLGEPVTHSMFSIIRSAHADAPVRVASCLEDHPKVASAVRNLATGRDLPVRDYMPGFYGAPWLGGFHGNLVTVDKAYVPRDSGSPVPKPELMIYRHYRGSAAAKPSYSHRVPVNVYRGKKATLYRIFVNGPVRCIDFVKANVPGNAQGRLYYDRDGRTYLAHGAFALKN